MTVVGGSYSYSFGFVGVGAVVVVADQEVAAAEAAEPGVTMTTLVMNFVEKQYAAVEFADAGVGAVSALD